MRSFDRDRFFKCPSPLRINDELKHNPYVGSFHGVARPSEEQKSTNVARHNPHLGIIRHSPAASSFPVKLNLGFKGLLCDDECWKTSLISKITCGHRFATQLHLTERLVNRLPIAIFSYPGYLHCGDENCVEGSLSRRSSGSVRSSDSDEDSEFERALSQRNQHSGPEAGVGGDEWQNVESSGVLDAPPICAICLDCFSDGCELRSLPGCGHSFHRRCIDIWLLGQHSAESANTAVCPTCRQDVSVAAPTAPSTPVTGSLRVSIPAVEDSAEGASSSAERQRLLRAIDSAAASSGTGSPVRSAMHTASNSAIASPVPTRVPTRGEGADLSSLMSSPAPVLEADASPPIPAAGGAPAVAAFPDVAFANVGRFLFSNIGQHFTFSAAATAAAASVGTEETPSPEASAQQQVTPSSSSAFSPTAVAAAAASASATAVEAGEDDGIVTDASPSEAPMAKEVVGDDEVEDDDTAADDDPMIGSTYALCGVPLSYRNPHSSLHRAAQEQQEQQKTESKEEK